MAVTSLNPTAVRERSISLSTSHFDYWSFVRGSSSSSELVSPGKGREPMGDVSPIVGHEASRDPTAVCDRVVAVYSSSKPPAELPMPV